MGRGWMMGKRWTSDHAAEPVKTLPLAWVWHLRKPQFWRGIQSSGIHAGIHENQGLQAAVYKLVYMETGGLEPVRKEAVRSLARTESLLPNVYIQRGGT